MMEKWESRIAQGRLLYGSKGIDYIVKRMPECIEAALKGDADMNGSRLLSVTRFCSGNAEGKTLISEDDICFYLADPKNGKIIEKNHALKGKVFRKNSDISKREREFRRPGDGLYMLKKCETAPDYDHSHLTRLVTGAIIMKIPLVTGWRSVSTARSKMEIS